MRYRLEVFGGFTITQAQVITTGGATNITVFNTRNGVPVEWSLKWVNDGDIKIRYSVSNGSRIWSDKVTPTLSFDVLEYDAGQIRPIPLTPFCAPIYVVLSLDRLPTGSPYVFQYCNTGDCSVASSNWMNNNPATSVSFPDISINTSFRIKLTDNRCGTFQSTPVMINVKPTPSVNVSDKFIFSGGSFDVPSTNMEFSTIEVKANAAGVTGASDLSLLQGSNMGTLATQSLTTNGPSDGAVVYSITPSKGGCTGQTKTATVMVYATPVIFSDRKYIYKGQTATLGTGNYDSYLWQTDSGDVLGSASTYKVSVPDKYRVAVTKNGARATSDAIKIGGQFSDINENYILTQQPQKEFTSAIGLGDQRERDVSESIQYFDGLGRPLQNITIRMSPSHHDMIQPFAYDQFGRESIKYLPYVSLEDNGRIRQHAIEEQPGFYHRPETNIPVDNDPHSQTIFEESPLGRVLKQGAAGTAWQPSEEHPDLEHVVHHEYLLNTATDSIMRFAYDYDHQIVTKSLFATGTLYKNITTDEDHHEAIEFVDKLNRTICKKMKAGDNLYACTYYVFDDIGNLVMVVPPEGAKAFSSQ